MIKKILKIIFFGIIFYLLFLIPSVVVLLIIFNFFTNTESEFYKEYFGIFSYILNLIVTIFGLYLYFGRKNQKKIEARNTDTCRCLKCLRLIDVKCEMTYLGFYVFECPKCHTHNTYPLNWTYRIIYYIIAIVSVLGMFTVFAKGNGSGILLPIAPIMALVYDYKIKKHNDEILGKF